MSHNEAANLALAWDTRAGILCGLASQEIRAAQRGSIGRRFGQVAQLRPRPCMEFMQRLCKDAHAAGCNADEVVRLANCTVTPRQCGGAVQAQRQRVERTTLCGSIDPS